MGSACHRPATLGDLTSSLPSAAWQGVERDLRSQMSGSERGLVEEYVEKVPNPSLKSVWGRRPGREGPGQGPHAAEGGGRRARRLPTRDAVWQHGSEPRASRGRYGMGVPGPVSVCATVDRPVP